MSVPHLRKHHGGDARADEDKNSSLGRAIGQGKHVRNLRGVYLAVGGKVELCEGLG